MHDVESRLRATLADHAGDAPPLAGLLSDVHQQSHRRRRLRTGLAGTAALAVAVLAAALGPRLLVTHDAASPARPAAPPTTHPPVAGSALVPPKITAPVFPFAAAPRPSGFARPTTRLAGGAPTLAYVSTGARPESITLAVQDTAPPCASAGDRVAVRGRTGLAHDEEFHRVLCWQEGPDQWVEEVASVSVSRQAMLAVAERLGQGTTAIDVPFSFDLLPEGLVLDDMSASVMSFRLSGEPRTPDAFIGELTVLLNERGEADADAKTVDVGGRRGWIHSEGTDLVLNVYLEGAVLAIQVPGSLHLDEADVIRLGAGVHVLPAAHPGKG